MSTTHRIKVWPQFFRGLSSGDKTFEVRRDDRGYKVGDKLELVEWDPGKECETGRSLPAEVTWVFRGGSPEMDPWRAISDGFVVLGLRVDSWNPPTPVDTTVLDVDQWLRRQWLNAKTAEKRILVEEQMAALRTFGPSPGWEARQARFRQMMLLDPADIATALGIEWDDFRWKDAMAEIALGAAALRREREAN